MMTRLWILAVVSIFLSGASDALAEEARSVALTRPNAVADEPRSRRVNNTKIKVEAYEYSWRKSFEWKAFNRSEVEWKAIVKNNNPEPRHICITYEFLDEDNLPVFSNGKCEVVRGLSEGEITGTIMVKSHLLEEVATDNVVPLEAHRLHSFVRPQAPQ